MARPPSASDSVRILLDDWIHPIPLESHFDVSRPLEVDVGCGKGRFLLNRAKTNPDVDYLGIDRMLRRVRKVDRKAVRRGLDNVRLLRMDAYYAVAYLLPPQSVSVYYIFFPDPWPKKRHHGNRLFDPPFINTLEQTLADGGIFHFATDHRPYYEEVCEMLKDDRRFESIPPLVPGPEEQTDFERLYIDEKPIGRLSCRKR